MEDKKKLASQDQDATKKSKWYHKQFTHIKAGITGQTKKFLKAVNITEDKVVASTKELTEDEKFVNMLYKRVHTQSQLLQN